MFFSDKNSHRSIISDYSAFNVVEGLSYTPAEMYDLSKKGIPISSQSVNEDFYDGDSTALMYLEPARRRGFDIIDAWNLEKTTKSKLMSAHLNDVQMFE